MENAAARPPRVLHWALALGIAIVLNVCFFSIGAIALPVPQYSAYCPVQGGAVPQSPKACDAAGGTWIINPAGPAPASARANAPAGYCDLYTKCQQPYQNAVNRRALEAFALMATLGITAVITGLFPLGSSAISSGLSYGGALALVIGSLSYWGTAGNWIRLLIAMAGLAALLLVGWKRFRDER